MYQKNIKIIDKIDKNFLELLSGASLAVVFKIIAAGSSFSLSIILARIYGAEISGIFYLSLTIIVVISSIGRFGMENILVKFTAAYSSTNKYGDLLGVYRFAMMCSLVISAALSVLLFFGSDFIAKNIFSKPGLDLPLSIMAIGVVPLSLLTLNAYVLQGLRKVGDSILILNVLVPFLACGFALTVGRFFGAGTFYWCYVATLLGTMAVSYGLWKFRSKSFSFVATKFVGRELLGKSIPMFFVVLMNLIITWAPMLILGIYETKKNVGIFNAANRTSMLVSFVLVSVNMIAAPKFATLYEGRDFNAIKLVAQYSAKIMFWVAMPLLVIFFVFPSFFMTVFGEEFIVGGAALRILAAGQFINVVTGSVGYLLLMTDNELLMRNILIFDALLCSVLCVVLIPLYGTIGGAIATSLALSMQNIVAMYYVYKKFNIITLPWASELMKCFEG